MMSGRYRHRNRRLFCEFYDVMRISAPEEMGLFGAGLKMSAQTS